MVTIAGITWFSDFPTTSGAYDTTFSVGDAFVTRLDPSKIGSAQLVYSTFLGGTPVFIPNRGWVGGSDSANALSVDAIGVVTVAGWTTSINFPTTSGAYDTTFNGGYTDAFVSRLDPSTRR